MAGKTGLDMLLWQYANSQNLKDYIQCFLDEFQEVRTALADSLKYRYLSDAFGVMLDDIAYLVGTSRIIYGAQSLGFFGFYENPSALPAGDDAKPGQGGILRSDSDKESGDFVRTDAQLVNAIRARIIKTMSNCNTEDLYVFCDLVLNRELPLEIVEGNQAVSFIYHGVLPPNDKTLLAHMLPDIKPAGMIFTLKDDDGNIALMRGSINYPPDSL